MDKSALTEQRREMVINLLKGMKIRKSDGEGFDKDDVYACMQQLCDVYEKSIDDLTVSYETEIGELQEKYQKYDENNDLYISLIMEAKKSSNEIINKAKSEVDEILAAGKEQIALQEDEIAKFREAIDEEKAALSADLEASRQAAEQEKADLAAAIEEERIHSETVREQYKDQIAVMDQEFDEIKMNILRTAGKIDGLRAQLEDAEEAPEWEVQAEPVPVDVPQPDLTIEETAEEAPVEEPAEAPAELTFEDLVAKLQQDDFANAGDAVEVEAPAETPVVEPITEVFEEAPVEEPAFEIPAEPEIEIPAEEPAEVIEEAVELPAFEAPAEPVIDFPAEEAPAEFVEELPVEEVAPEEVVADAVEEALPEITEEELAPIEDLALEDLSVEAPEAIEDLEEPIEEISFEGLEELFKE